MSHFLIREHVDGAIHSLRRTRTRTLLTTLGVAIGVASITTILSLSGGILHSVEGQVDNLHGTTAVVRPGYANEQTSGDFTNPMSGSNYSTSTLTAQDAQDIMNMSNVKAAAPIMLMSGKLHAAHQQTTVGTLVATTPDFAIINNLKTDEGQFMDGGTVENTAVIGQTLAVRLFGTSLPLGQQFNVRGQTFTVIGVLARVNQPVNFNGFDMDDAVYISLASGENFHQGMAQIQQIDVLAKSRSKLRSVTQAISTTLTSNHEGEHDFSIVTGRKIAQPTSRLFQVMTAVMTAIAAISLVVGGIGIMNIMLVGVAERTREIGLRKAVGASNGQIVSQFLIESLLISLIGGVVGYVSGYLIAFMVSTFLPFNPALTWQIAVVDFVVSLGVGALFGAYPAYRAARKDPIESLRSYQ